MTLKSSHLAAFALLLALTAVQPVNAAEKAAAKVKPVATVNNVAIPQARFDLNLKAITEQGQPDNPELRKQIKEELINLELIAQEARRQGLDKQPEVIQIVELTKQKILRSAFAQDYLKHNPVAEEKLQEIYASQKAAAGNKEFKVAQIMVESEKEALAIAAQLKNKGDFGKIAKEKSLDGRSKGQGGELGWTTQAAFMPSFRGALLKLKKGEVSAPVQTQFGWHLIKLEDVRDFVMPPYDQVKATLEKRLQQMALEEAVKELRAKAKID